MNVIALQTFSVEGCSSNHYIYFFLGCYSVQATAAAKRRLQDYTQWIQRKVVVVQWISDHLNVQSPKVHSCKSCPSSHELISCCVLTLLFYIHFPLTAACSLRQGTIILSAVHMCVHVSFSPVFSLNICLSLCWTTHLFYVSRVCVWRGQFAGYNR